MDGILWMGVWDWKNCDEVKFTQLVYIRET